MNVGFFTDSIVMQNTVVIGFACRAVFVCCGGECQPGGGECFADSGT
jgi:hypothetical protein